MAGTRLISNGLEIVGAVFAMLLAVADQVCGAPPGANGDWLPQQVVFKHQVSSEYELAQDGYSGYSDYTSPFFPGKVVSVRYAFRPENIPKTSSARRDFGDPTFHDTGFSVREGDLIPFFGGLYRAGKFGLNGGLQFGLLPARDYPPGMELSRHSYYLLNGSDTILYGDSMAVIEIIPMASGKPAQARIGQNRIYREIPIDPKKPVEYRWTQIVSEGDLLKIDRSGGNQRPKYHEVLHVVPPDPDAHIPGWVEIDMLATDPDLKKKAAKK